MNTLFENQMDLFTKLERADITDWMHVKTKSWVSQQNELYKFKPLIKIEGYKSEFDKVKVVMNLYANNTIAYISAQLMNKYINYNALNIIPYSIDINLSDEDEINKKITKVVGAVEWNKYINLPSNMIDDITTRLREYLMKAYNGKYSLGDE